MGDSAGAGRWILIRRSACAGSLAVLVIAGLAVHAMLPDTAATDIAGDALYAAAAYAFVAAIAVRQSPLVVGAIAVTWCVGIELFQLTGLPLAAGAAFPPAMLVLGTVFDPRDLVVYVVTIVAVTATDAGIGRLRDKGH
jgi:hypothetical protein